MQTVVIAGGTGLIGTAISKLLVSKGYNVIILTRKEREANERIRYSVWHPEKNVIDPEVIKQAHHIIHVAGAGIADKRWTRKRKTEILTSRVNAGKLLVKALGDIPNKVQTVVSASAMGWYGEDKKYGRPFIEADPPADNFLGHTCAEWEASIAPVKNLGIRLVILRMGIVLSPDGGAFPEFMKPMKSGIAAILGNGSQVISWIHIDDLSRLYLMAIENKNMEGVFNAVAPEPVTNKEFTLKLAKRRGGSGIPVHVPALFLKLIMGEMSVEVLKSATVDDTKVRKHGFTFVYPTIDAALSRLISVKTEK